MRKWKKIMGNFIFTTGNRIEMKLRCDFESNIYVLSFGNDKLLKRIIHDIIIKGSYIVIKYHKELILIVKNYLMIEILSKKINTRI